MICPKLDDYVSWRNVEGWVYYIDDTHLTIEISVRPKEDDLVPRHKKHHCLIVVQDFQYDELVYVNSRRDTQMLRIWRIWKMIRRKFRVTTRQILTIITLLAYAPLYLLVTWSLTLLLYLE